ncbi:MAG: DUF2285 domain-containing protein [Alphaproteobacteria bacterium]|nr:DUF2285 domain-containing protein [Alphaproteobacteria bacterium]
MERLRRGPFGGRGAVPSAWDRRAGARERKRAELMTVLEADQKGLTRRQIAELLWGEKRVAEEWHPDSWMQGRVKRHLANARAITGISPPGERSGLRSPSIEEGTAPHPQWRRMAGQPGKGHDERCCDSVDMPLERT